MPNDVIPALHLQIFAGEATDHLRALRSGLASLDGEHDDIAIPHILRSAHGLKGSAHMLGFQDISDFCHRVESAVLSIAQGRESDVGDLVEILQHSVDLLEHMVSAALAGDPMPASDDVARRLEGFIRDGAPDSTIGPRLRAAAQGPAALRAPTLRSPLASNGSLSNRLRQLGPQPEAAGAIRADGTGSRAGSQGMVLVPLADLDSLVQLCHELRRYERTAASVTRQIPFVRRLLGESRVTAQQEHDGGPAPALSRHLTALEQSAERHAQVARLSSQLDRLARELRFCRVDAVFGYLSEAVKTIAKNDGKRARLWLNGKQQKVERELIHGMSAPIVHLVSNAVHHGLEDSALRTRRGKPPVGTVTLVWKSTSDRWRIQVADDGKGIDPQLIRQAAWREGLMPEWLLESMSDDQVVQFIFRDGFSTSQTPNLASGRGIGLAIVKEAVSRLSGQMQFESRPGLGTTFTIDIPRTVANK